MISNPEINLSYQLTYKDYVAGYKLGVRQSPFALVPYLLARFLGPFVAFLFLLLAVFSFASGHREAVAGTIPIILLCGLMPVIYIYGWRAGFKRLQRDTKKNPHITFQADETSFQQSIEGMDETTWLWAATKNLTYNKKVALVSGQANCFVIIPRKFISDSQLARLKTLIQQNKA